MLMEQGGSSGGGGTTDTQAPSAPNSLSSSSKTANSVNLSWNASTDNVGVTSYNVYKNSILVGTSTSISTNVGTIANNASKSWNVSAITASNYKLSITSTSSQNSRLITVSFNGTSIQQAIDSNQTIQVYFNGVAASPNTLTITANSVNVSISSISAVIY